MFLRLVVVTFLLGVAAFIQIKGTKTLPTGAFSPAYTIIIATFFLSLLYILLHKRIQNVKVNIYSQAICDVILITVLVYITDGISSVYSVLYQLVIIYSALFLGKRGGVIAASCSSVLYGLLLDLQYYCVFPLYNAPCDYDFSAGYVLSRIFIHIVSFYIVAFLVSFVVEQEKKSRLLLTEKESEFDQLDLLYKSIIKSVNSGIVTIDLMGKIKSFNRAMEEISGLSFSAVENKEIDYVIPGFSKTLDKMKSEKGEDEPVERGEIVVSNKQGGDIILGFSLSSLMDSGENKIGDIAIFQDLTATKEMEREVEKSKNLALIGEMAAGLAHEIRNPLTAMIGSIQLLERNLNLDKTDERLMQIVVRGRDQIENLVGNFLLLARPNLTDWEEIDINDIIDDVLEDVRCGPEWHENIQVEKEAFGGARIHGNRTEVKQMFYNLVLNSVQSMPDGGALQIMSRTSTSDNGETYLGISISDTGCGIEKDKESKIFVPFYTTKENGTGLGLAIATRVLESHGGTIEIESEVGIGTTCKLLLPRNNRLPQNTTG